MILFNNLTCRKKKAKVSHESYYAFCDVCDLVPREFGGVQQGEFWCSTKVDSEGNHVDGEGEYGFCSPECSPINLFDLIQELLGDVESGRTTRHPNNIVAFAKNQ